MLGGFFKRKTEEEQPKLSVWDWLHESRLDASFTPDIAKLERYKYQLIFVYDETMFGHPQAQLLKDKASLLSKAITKNQYTMWKRKLGKETYPVAMDKKFHNLLSAPIKGELYRMRPKHFIELDSYKDNGVRYYRKRIDIVVPWKEVVRHKTTNVVITKAERKTEVKAWMYIGVPDFWEEVLDAGFMSSPVRCFQPNDPRAKPYYMFTKLEYDK